MGLILKTGNVIITQPDGSEQAINVIADNTTARAISAIESKKNEVLADIPADYTDVSNKLDAFVNNSGAGIAELNFIEGKGLSSDGTIQTNSKRAVVKDAVFVRKGTKITVSDGYSFNIAECGASATDKHNANAERYLYAYRSISGDPYIVTRDCFVRIGMRNPSNTPITAEEAAANIYVSGVGGNFITEHRGVPVCAALNEYFYANDFEDYNIGIDDFYNKWIALETSHPNHVSHSILGTSQSASGAATYPIYKFTIDPKVNSFVSHADIAPTNTLKILWIAGIHGYEKKSMMASYLLFKDLLNRHWEDETLRMLWENCKFEIIPCCNPYGMQNNVRTNSRGVDLNRNFDVEWTAGTDSDTGASHGSSPESEAETKIIADFIRENTDAFIAVNVHDSSNADTGKAIGYIASNYLVDQFYGNIAGRLINSTIRKHYSDVISRIPTFSQENIFHTYLSSKYGSMDKWFNKIGVHGFLIETAPVFIAGDGESDFIQKSVMTCHASILATFVKNNMEILDDNRQLRNYQ